MDKDKRDRLVAAIEGIRHSFLQLDISENGADDYTEREYTWEKMSEVWLTAVVEIVPELLAEQS